MTRDQWKDCDEFTLARLKRLCTVRGVCYGTAVRTAREFGWSPQRLADEVDHVPAWALSPAGAA